MEPGSTGRPETQKPMFSLFAAFSAYAESFNYNETNN
jgi:hypothetical protein